MGLYTHNVKNIKGATYKTSDVDGTCKRTLRPVYMYRLHACVRQSHCQSLSLCQW